MRLDELFIIKNGISSTGLSIEKDKQPHHLPYIRPASTQQRTIAGWVWLRDIDQKDIYPAETLFVSTNGEGSHSYSYVSSFEFVANSDISILIPKRYMSLTEKLFYSYCITQNRYKFSYGRKPKGKRLASIILPDCIPDELNKKLTDSLVKSHNKVNQLNTLFDIPNKKEISIISKNAILVPLNEIFTITYGVNMELYKFDECKHTHHNAIPFVSRTEKNNGVSAFVEKRIGYEPNPAHTLSVATGGTVLATFYQPKPYYSGRDLYYLTPRKEMIIGEMLYYAMIIRANAYRYSYGRQANKTLKDILVPDRMPENLKTIYKSDFWIKTSLLKVF